MYLIMLYVPVEACDDVKEAMFDAGGGAFGLYDRCAWQTRGEGQFRALAGSNPAIGRRGQETKVDEYKLEMICVKEQLPAVLAAMKASHPYETPAYSVIATSPSGETSTDKFA